MKRIPQIMLAAALGSGLVIGVPQAFAAGQAGAAPQHMRAHSHGQMLERLKAQLQITQAQEPAWNSFVQAMEKTMPKRGERKAMRQHGGALQPAPEVLEAQAQRLAQFARDAEARAQAMKSLYAALTPTQRAIIDTHVADMGHRFHARRAHRG